MAELRSRRFLLDFANRFDLKKVLFPGSWDNAHHRWIKSDAMPSNSDGSPNDELVYEKLSGLVDAETNLQTGIITVKFLWDDPAGAARLANEMVDLLNERVRMRAQSEASGNLDYLEAFREKNQSASMNEAIAHLMEVQLQQKMMASAVGDYAFTIIDPAIPPIHVARPRRLVIASLIFLIVAAVSSAWVLVMVRRRMTG